MEKTVYTIVDNKNGYKVGNVILKDKYLMVEINNEGQIVYSMSEIFKLTGNRYDLIDINNNIYSEEIHELYIQDIQKYGMGKYIK